ncbi:MAG: dihydrolipoamide acetyltransferase component of pyruvate dehydrogenase complex [Vicingaceae bacterium]|nr:MAG: dihydrolipoamide acetyltransferase component of pyruvate dehydrogenase complex [Vicingaceae bacterium]
MGKIELRMPKMGESVMEATIIKWCKNEGDSFEAEETLLEIATDKVDSEVPAPESGVLVKKLFNEGDVVKVGEVIAILETASKSESSGEETKTEEPVVMDEPLIAEGAVETTGSNTMEIPRTSSSRFYSPLVRSIAAKEGITLEELEKIPGTGKDGRVTKHDILNYLPKRKASQITSPTNGQSVKSEPTKPQSVPATAPQVQSPATQAANISIKQPEVFSLPGDEIIEMDRMRKLIADHMVMSKHVSPHVTSFVEADVTNIVLWREKVKKKFEEKYGEKLTFTPIFIEAIVKALKDYPMVNVSVSGDKIIKRKQINIGMATALPSGNLIVPVIKNADELNLAGLAKRVNDLARRARENKLQPDEIQGGTYTITNVGTFGNVMGTPVINQPQAAILATGAIRKKPAVVETPQGDMIAIRHMMFLSHSYDHRVIDGALGGSFVRRVADYLEAFDIDREI